MYDCSMTVEKYCSYQCIPSISDKKRISNATLLRQWSVGDFVLNQLQSVYHILFTIAQLKEYGIYGQYQTQHWSWYSQLIGK